MLHAVMSTRCDRSTEEVNNLNINVQTVLGIKAYHQSAVSKANSLSFPISHHEFRWRIFEPSKQPEEHYLHKIFRVCSSFDIEHVLRSEHRTGCVARRGGGWCFRRLGGTEIGINTTECLSHKSNSHLDNGEERDPLFTL
jgi:hypothetical protein